MEEPFTEEELCKGIKAGLQQRSVTPVFCGCAASGLGTIELIENIIEYAPNPAEGKPMVAVDEDGNESEVKLDPSGSPMAFVFNTFADQYGKNSYFKVISGDMEDTLTVVNARTGDNEKLGNMFFPKGKDNAKTSKVCCGDIGVFTKLASVRTGDTLGLAGKTVTIKPMQYDDAQRTGWRSTPRSKGTGGQNRFRPDEAQRGRRVLHLSAPIPRRRK